MIKDTEIVEIGKLIKPHGINGEIVTSLDADNDISSLKCIILKIDGINVPFFIGSIRPKSQEAVLLSIDDINNETEAAALCGSIIYALKTDIPIDEDRDDDVFYATDLVGYKIVENGILIGEITDIDDSTDNALFIVDRPDGATIYIPIADEFIVDISTETQTILTNLPQGILEL